MNAQGIPACDRSSLVRKVLTAGLDLIVMPVHMQDLEKPEQMYRKLGAKLVVGMPFKDQACSDTLVLRDIPPASETDKRRALARLQVRVWQVHA